MTLPPVEEWRGLWADVGGGWLAADGFSGLGHPDGRYLFLHGDTLWNAPTSDGTRPAATRNSVTVWDPAEGVVGTPSSPLTDFIPAPVGGWFWHGDMIWDWPDVWLFALRARAVSGGWGFEMLPRALVQLSWPSHAEPRWVETYPAPVVGRVDWGASMVRAPHPEPWIYVYGVLTEPGWFGHDVYVARVRTGHLKDPSFWRFWAGLSTASGRVHDVWSSDEAKALPVIDHTVGPCGTFSSNVMPGTKPGTGQYRIVSKTPGDFGGSVAVWTSPTPVGPWAWSKVADVPWTSADMTYGAFAHPDLGLTEYGRRLVSVNHNTDVGLVGLFEEPWRYRPSWHEVPW